MSKRAESAPKVDREAVWAMYFGLKTVGDLRAFHDQLDMIDPLQAALRYYIESWSSVLAEPKESVFEPRAYISPDRSAVMLGDCATIFEGSNDWFLKPYAAKADLTKRLEGLLGAVAAIRRHNPSRPMCLIVAPEKDYFISKAFKKESRFAVIDEAFAELGRALQSLSVPLVFNEPLDRMEQFMSLEELSFPDSHLSGRNYIVFFARALQALGMDWEKIRPEMAMAPQTLYGDLSQKFVGRTWGPFNGLVPNVPKAALVQSAGSETFESPLGDTWQAFENSACFIDKKVCLLGDSHSSIFKERRLTYLFSSVYRTTEFHWNPAGLRSAPGEIDADHIVLEVSSRFVI